MYREFFQFSSGSDGSGGEESDLEEMYHEIEVRDQGPGVTLCNPLVVYLG